MTTQASGATAPGAPRRRRPPRPVTVAAVSSLAPRLVSVLVTGEGLDGFAGAAPTSHLKVFLPAEGQAAPVLPEHTPDGAVSPSGGPRPVVRTYTPRRYDPATRTLEIWFLLHGAGPAAEWAQRARPGDEIAVAGPGGRFSLEPAAGHWWLAGDESAIPAIATLLDALPAAATVQVHVEVAGREDEIELGGAAKTTVTYHRRRSPGSFGAELAEAARGAEFPAGGRVWVACESGAMRGIRRYLLGERGLPRPLLVTRGYWLAGQDNYRDGDYGED